ncbi:TetR family transcriptional regulator [Paenibacillus sp. NEAU-GSW1]|nr:TetR family transcriptional regulator [Paenibacillus sp. NEAU-GSW1]
MDDLAQRAGVSQPTIYRRWRSKEEMISDTIGFSSNPVELPESGNALEDIKDILLNMLQSMDAMFAGAPFSPRLIASMLDSAFILEQYRNDFILPRRVLYTRKVREGKERGEIRRDADDEVLVDLVCGAYIYCVLFRPEVFDRQMWFKQVFDLVKNGVASLRNELK